MDENINPHYREPLPGHEVSDVNIWAIGKFGIALVVIVLLSVGLLVGVFQFFQARENRVAKAIDPVKAFPLPQLLQNEPKNLAAFRAEETHAVDSYGWVDQQKGVVRIPVAQAIDLLAQRGLPARQPTATQVPAVSVPTESGLGQPQQGLQEETRK